MTRGSRNERQTAIDLGNQHRTKPVPLSEPDYESLLHKAWAPRSSVIPLTRRQRLWRAFTSFFRRR